MGLVEKFHVIASYHSVGSTDVIEGQLVKFDVSGDIVAYDGSGNVFGVAGDTKSTTTVGMPGVEGDFQNRVSDPGLDETSASGLMTVYHSGGEFATDQFESDVSASAVGISLYGSSNGKLQAASSGSVLAILTRAAGPYPSGVPGVDINGDIALAGDNSNTYIEYKLLI